MYQVPTVPESTIQHGRVCKSFTSRHNPWAAPGTAPVADACGLAGGTPWPQEVSEAGDYTATVFAHHGMNGTVLSPLETGVRWRIGGVAEVTRQIDMMRQI